MDKIEKIIDMTEHPEKYSEEELQQLLVNDEEGRKTYRTICEIQASMCANEVENVEEMRPMARINFFKKAAAIFVGASLLSGIAYAMVATGFLSILRQQPQNTPVDSTVVVEKKVVPKMVGEGKKHQVEMIKTYEDVTLDKILADIASCYDMTVAYHSRKAATLRLYFKFDSRRGVEKTVDDLNSFENITITIQSDMLVVE